VKTHKQSGDIEVFKNQEHDEHDENGLTNSIKQIVRDRLKLRQTPAVIRDDILVCFIDYT
jgi:hypothetical protein